MTPNPQGRNLRIRTFLIFSWAMLFSVGIWLRLGALESRPMHADEAVQAMIFADLMDNGHYAYNPHHYHGPSLYYGTLPVAWIRGARSAAGLDEMTLRLVPFLFGLLLAATPVFLRRELGVTGSLVAGGFLLLSPGLVYYSGYYIQEMILLAGLAWFLACSWRWPEDGKLSWAIGAGISAGLMLASKENAPLLILLAGGSLYSMHRGLSGRGNPAFPGPPVHLWWALVAALAVALPLYSSFGRNPAGIVDAFRSWFLYEVAPGHGKPWYYYLSLLSGWSRSPIQLQGEAGMVLPAILSAIIFLIPGKRHECALIGKAMLLFSCLLLLLLSLVAYKTPWLVLVILVSMALVNGAGVSLAWNRWRATAARAAILALVAVCWLGLAREAYWTTRVRPADERNPYAYVHTSWDLPVLAGRIHRVSGNESRPVIKIMAEEYWPLPWYLRNLDQVGYWHTLPADPYAPVMVVGAELAGGLEPGRLMDYQVEIRGLRPGRLLLVYVRQDLWDDWTGYSP